MANRIQTHGPFESVTGWDRFWWTVWPRYEVRRVARKILEQKSSGKLNPEIDQRFVMPNGLCYLITSEDGDTEIDYRDVRRF